MATNTIGNAVLWLKAKDKGFAKGLNKGLKQVGAFTRKVGQTLKSVGRSATIAGAAIVAPLIGAVTKAASFDKAMREVNTLLRASEEDFEKLKEQTLEFSAAMGIDAVEAAQGMYEAFSKGAGQVKQDNVFDFLTAAAKTSIGGVADFKTTVNGLLNVINSYGKEIGDVSDVSDGLFQTMRSGGTTIEEMSRFFFQVGGEAKNANVKLDDLEAIIIAITAQGNPTSVAMTRVRAAINAIIKPTEEMKAAIRSLGFETGEAMISQIGLQQSFVKLVGIEDLVTPAMKRVQDSYEGAQRTLGKYQGRLAALRRDHPKGAKARRAHARQIADLGSKIAETTRKLEAIREKADFIKPKGLELIGKMFGSVEAIGAVLGVTGEKARFFSEGLKEIQDRAGATDKAFAEMEKSLTQQWNKMKAEIHKLVITIGTELFPVLRQLFDVLRPILQDISKWIKANPELTGQIVQWTAALGAALLVLGPVLWTLGGILTVIGKIGPAVKIVTAAFSALGFAGTAAIAGILLGLAAFIEMWTTGDWTQNFLTRLVEEYLPIYDKAIDFAFDKLIKFRKLLLLATPAGLLGAVIGGLGKGGPEFDQATRDRLEQGEIDPQEQATGGLSRGGISLVGERGPELVDMPAGARVFPAQQTQRMLAGAGGGGIVINIAQATVRENADIGRIARALSRRVDRAKRNRGEAVLAT